MQANAGTLDRALRILIGAALIAFALGFIGAGLPYRWIGWIGVIPLVTAVTGFCPLYRVLGLSTRA